MDLIDQIINRAEYLLPAPKLLPQLLHALNKVDSDLGQIVDLISFDPILTAKLLQVCNSVIYCGTDRVNNVSDAVNRLGLQIVYRIVAMVIGAKILNPSSGSCGTDAEGLWRYSVISAFAAQFIADDASSNSDLLFTAGLLHEMGQVVMMEAFKGKYSQLATRSDQDIQALVDKETLEFGTNHSEVGARLLERWNYSPQLVACVRYHHNPADAGEYVPLAACVNLGDSIAYHVELERSRQQDVWLSCDPALRILRLSMEDMPRYVEQIKEKMEYVEAMCHLRY